MMMIRFFKIFVFICCLAVQPYAAQASIRAEYEAARVEFISALVSMASYSDRAGVVAREDLADNGWFMRPHSENFQGIDAKFFMAFNNDFLPDQEAYILAVTGTEDIKDIKADLSFSKVLFGGGSPDEFIEKAAAKHLTNAAPMIHRGFNKYVNTAFFSREYGYYETFGEYLAGFLREKPSRKLYMVGHSLGGAVATVGAARLISLGVDKSQLEVVTFGAPAVGNEAFAVQFGQHIPLKRIVMRGDPVKGILQSITGIYVQFGEQVNREPRLNIYRSHHAAGTYVDAAIRNYYDKRAAMAKAGYEAENTEMQKQGDAMAYFSPPQFHLDETLEADRSYMLEVAYDSLRHDVDGFVFGAGAREALERELEKARAAGCKWLVQGGFVMDKNRKEPFSYYVSYQENIYEAESGELKDALLYTNSTEVFTPLQSVLHNLSEAQGARARLLRER